jgi:hypothetical protein
MQLLNRLLVVLFFGLFGVTALLMAYSSHVAQQSGRVSVERGSDFPGSWIFLIFIVLFGIALCILSILLPFYPAADRLQTHVGSVRASMGGTSRIRSDGCIHASCVHQQFTACHPRHLTNR